MPNDQSPATKQDLEALENRLTETMRDMHTEMLRAFHNWAKPTEIKTRSLGATIAGLERESPYWKTA